MAENIRIINVNTLQLLFQPKIEVQYIEDDNTQSLGYIYQPTLQDILNCGGEHMFKLYVSMFCLTKEILLDELHIKDQISGICDIEQIKLLDLFFLLSNDSQNEINHTVKKYNMLLIKALSLFYKTSNIKHSNNIGFIIDDTYEINRNNFDVLCVYIRKICDASILKKEKVPKFKNQRQKDIYYKLMAGRERQAKRDHISIKNMVDLILLHNNFNYQDIINKTYLQIINDYKLSCIQVISDTSQIHYNVEVAVSEEDTRKIILLQKLKEIEKE